MTTGERIKSLMIESNIKPHKLAEWLGITHTSVHRYLYDERVPTTEILIRISETFDVSIDWLLGRSEHRNYHGFISGDDAMEYCWKAEKACEMCRQKAVAAEYEELSPITIANLFESQSYFEREICRWHFDIPRMIHSLADGTWKEHFEDEQSGKE